MLTEQERREIGRIPFIAYQRRSRITFIPILIAFVAMSTILLLLGLFFHTTIPEWGLHTQISSTPTSAVSMTRIAGGSPQARPFLLPFLDNP